MSKRNLDVYDSWILKIHNFPYTFGKSILSSSSHSLLEEEERKKERKNE
jgi:hypothetical protein